MSHARRGLVVAVVGLALVAGCSTRTGPTRVDATKPPSTREFQPSAQNKDPSRRIDGVVVTEYKGATHAPQGQRVAYDKSPPYGGAHDYVWADCSGTVYATAVRNENMVHALEHGAVWIAYDPTAISGSALDALANRVEGQPYMMLSPYPGLDEPISLQSWGHQLKLDDADDERIDQFIAALRENEYAYPEPGARCDSEGTGFDPANPPPFDPSPPGPGAYPVQGP